MAVAAWGTAAVPARAAQARQARWRRLRALVLDFVIFSIVVTIVNYVYGVTQVTSGSPPNGQPGAFFYNTVTAVAWPWLLILWMAYYIVPESIYGASPGKMFLGLRVVRVDGARLRIGSIVTRNLLRLVDVLPGFYLLGGICVLATANSQRVGDRWAGTTVVLSDHAEPQATRRPAPGASRALAIALLAALALTVGFAYFGRPPLVLEGLFNQHQLMGPDLSSYKLGSPRWELGRVTYPLTGYAGGKACTGSISLEWSWPLGWTMTDGTLDCPAPI